MPTYDVRLARRAEGGLRRLRRRDPAAYRRVAAAIRTLASEPRPQGSKRLSGVQPHAWRLRIGEYRVVYEIDGDRLIVLVVNVAPRGEVYR